MQIVSSYPVSRKAQLLVGWVSDSVTHADVGFRASTQPTSSSYLIAPSYLEENGEIKRKRFYISTGYDNTPLNRQRVGDTVRALVFWDQSHQRANQHSDVEATNPICDCGCGVEYPHTRVGHSCHWTVIWQITLNYMRWKQRLAQQSATWSPPASVGADVTLEGDEVYTRGENPLAMNIQQFMNVDRST